MGSRRREGPSRPSRPWARAVLLALFLHLLPPFADRAAASPDVGTVDEDSAEPAPPVDDLVPHDPREALDWLRQGNDRFATGRPRHGHQDLVRRAVLASEQHPFATILGCADSRVPPELLFDHGLGDLFVIRVAGNVVADDEAGSIEYAVDHLDTRLVVVLGHEGCGAITAALGVARDRVPVELETLMERIRPALIHIDRSLPIETQVHLGVEANVRQSMAQLREIAEQEQEQEQTDHDILIVGAVYDLETGRVRWLEE